MPSNHDCHDDMKIMVINNGYGLWFLDAVRLSRLPFFEARN